MINNLAEIAGRLEYRYVSLCYLNYLPRTRVVNRPRSAMLHLKGPKASDLNGLTFCQRIYHGGDKAVNNGFGFPFGQAGSGCYTVDNIRFIHVVVLGLMEQSSRKAGRTLTLSPCT